MSANRDDILLVENPEVHLHPAGQAKMGRFLAEVATSGVQVVIETHSDHVLNGVRRAIMDKVVASTDVALHFFQPRSERARCRRKTPQVQSPVIDTSGNIDAWPEGFFDQFDKDMSYLAGWG